MPAASANKPRGRSENRADYQAAFLRRVHCLLQLGYEALTPSDYQAAEEDDITGDLCKEMQKLTEEEPVEPWMSRFSVHDQHPSHNVRSPDTGKVRKGKRRPKIDIRLVSKQWTPNQSYWVEAKRLYRSDSVSEYAEGQGVGAFTCGEYASSEPCGGMIGYVQAETVERWLKKIEKKLDSLSGVVRGGTGKSWVKSPFKGGPECCFVTQHQRDGQEDIALYHVMFSFV